MIQFFWKDKNFEPKILVPWDLLRVPRVRNLGTLGVKDLKYFFWSKLSPIELYFSYINHKLQGEAKIEITT